VLYAHGCTPISKVAFRDVPLLIRIFGRLALICSQPDMVSFLNLQTGARKSAYTPSVTIRKKQISFFRRTLYKVVHLRLAQLVKKGIHLR